MEIIVINLLGNKYVIVPFCNKKVVKRKKNCIQETPGVGTIPTQRN